ncbi:hypothetical protein ABB27_03560 [Stenotrophomonas terrae]|uniref:Uncharacterized protein n=1 Tax=Stenotrophomonas terrae TaxID=405446 RepID=A0A0R0D1U2_9GAMM|nr:hypothetical protein ABB27_03560 [Stenotrophomonas terrae]
MLGASLLPLREKVLQIANMPDYFLLPPAGEGARRADEGVLGFSKLKREQRQRHRQKLPSPQPLSRERERGYVLLIAGSMHSCGR